LHRDDSGMATPGQSAHLASVWDFRVISTGKRRRFPQSNLLPPKKSPMHLAHNYPRPAYVGFREGQNSQEMNGLNCGGYPPSKPTPADNKQLTQMTPPWTRDNKEVTWSVNVAKRTIPEENRSILVGELRQSTRAQPLSPLVRRSPYPARCPPFSVHFSLTLNPRPQTPNP
jgi:hypothetical protein